MRVAASAHVLNDFGSDLPSVYSSQVWYEPLGAVEADDADTMVGLESQLHHTTQHTLPLSQGIKNRCTRYQ